MSTLHEKPLGKMNAASLWWDHESIVYDCAGKRIASITHDYNFWRATFTSSADRYDIFDPSGAKIGDLVAQDKNNDKFVLKSHLGYDISMILLTGTGVSSLGGLPGEPHNRATISYYDFNFNTAHDKVLVNPILLSLIGAQRLIHPSKLGHGPFWTILINLICWAFCCTLCGCAYSRTMADSPGREFDMGKGSMSAGTPEGINAFDDHRGYWQLTEEYWHVHEKPDAEHGSVAILRKGDWIHVKEHLGSEWCLIDGMSSTAHAEGQFANLYVRLCSPDGPRVFERIDGPTGPGEYPSGVMRTGQYPGGGPQYGQYQQYPAGQNPQFPGQYPGQYPQYDAQNQQYPGGGSQWPGEEQRLLLQSVGEKPPKENGKLGWLRKPW
jgi:hypothetical protein